MEMSKEIDYMIQAALAGGREVLAVYSRPEGTVAVETKADNSPLTEADRRSHDVIETILNRSDPETPILSEEGSHENYEIRREWERYHLIDPLDGTKEFIKRNGEFTVNVALMGRGASHRRGGGKRAEAGADLDGGAEPLAGVVYAPYLRELYIGVVGIGAWRITEFDPEAYRPEELVLEVLVERARSIPDPTVRADRPYTIVASRSHMSRETEAFITARRTEHPDLNLISAGSSLKLCRVAEGNADEYPRFAPTMEWDTAAGDAVARAAGCSVVEWRPESEETDFGRSVGPLQYNKEDLHNPWFLVRSVSGRD